MRAAFLKSVDLTGATVSYDPGSNSWGNEPTLNEARSLPGGTNVGDTLIAAGGYNGASTTTTTETLGAGGPPPPPPPPPPPANCRGGAVTINDAAPATPYPSTCVVSGLCGSITDLNLDLNGLNHTYPDDIDMLLVSPGGQNAIFMSDAGGSFDMVNCNLTLDDEAPSQLDGDSCYLPGELHAG